MDLGRPKFEQISDFIVAICSQIFLFTRKNWGWLDFFAFQNGYLPHLLSFVKITAMSAVKKSLSGGKKAKFNQK